MRKLVSTSEAAKALGISRRTLQEWRTRGLVEPVMVTLGGHARWDVEELRRAMQDKRLRDE